MTCSLCGLKLLRRIYTFESRDSENNLCCSNLLCSNFKNSIIIFDNTHKVKYFCIDCGRTLLYKNNTVFGVNSSLTSGWLYVENYGVKNIKRIKCENYVLKYKNYKVCNFCGKITKISVNECNHNTINNVEFVKNNNDKKCVYCNRYLMKCKLCNETCYICVFEDCLKSQITGNKNEKNLLMCEKHSENYNLKKFIDTSNIICDNCGLKKYHREGDCIHNGDVYACNNCNREIMYYCYNCY